MLVILGAMKSDELFKTRPIGLVRFGPVYLLE